MHRQFWTCAEDEAEAEKHGGNVDFAMLAFSCLTEETFDTIASQSCDSVFYGQRLDEHSADVDFSYDSLGQKGKVLVDDPRERRVVQDSLNFLCLISQTIVFFVPKKTFKVKVCIK